MEILTNKTPAKNCKFIIQKLLLYNFIGVFTLIFNVVETRVVTFPKSYMLLTGKVTIINHQRHIHCNTFKFTIYVHVLH